MLTWGGGGSKNPKNVLTWYMNGPYVVTVKSMVKISQNFVAFSEYMNFNYGSFKKVIIDELCSSTSLY